MKGNGLVKKCLGYSRQWIRKDFQTVLHTIYPVNIAPIAPMSKNLGFSFNATVTVLEKDQGEWFWAENDLDRLRNLMLEKGFRNPAFVKKTVSRWEKYRLGVEKSHEKLLRTDLSALSDKGLLEAYESIYFPYVNESSIGYLADAISIGSESWLKAALEEEAGKSLEKEFPALIAFKFETFIFQEKKELLGIAKYLQQNCVRDFSRDAKAKAMLKRHSRKYFWILNNYGRALFLDADYFAEKARKMLQEGTGPAAELKRLKEESAAQQKRKKKLLKKHGFSRKARFMLEIVEEFGKMLDLRKRCVLIANHHFFSILGEAAKRTGISAALLHYCVYPEMREILSGKNREKWVETLKKRSERTAIFCFGNQHVITGEKIDKKPFYGVTGSVAEVRGVVACRGKATGHCRILLNSKNLEKVKEGDILVACNTTPDFVPAMQKAAAFVTDLGGITSHAAIVSREMKKPCIIGTGIGTRVFKDGD
ncbi:MAG: PEP-utilizing enzyme, partial [Candidatus Micrarchaeota archaeon]|nr:PEP-utilizing enzyme [Candidatus Micrarchaeota archaeon]